MLHNTMLLSATTLGITTLYNSKKFGTLYNTNVILRVFNLYIMLSVFMLSVVALSVSTFINYTIIHSKLGSL
jgi:hypothetical protein